MESLAKVYSRMRRFNLSKPASWLKNYSDEIMADEIDLLYLHKAAYLSDGTTVLFEDGSIAKKSYLQRRIPWIEQS